MIIRKKNALIQSILILSIMLSYEIENETNHLFSELNFLANKDGLSDPNMLNSVLSEDMIKGLGVMDDDDQKYEDIIDDALNSPNGLTKATMIDAHNNRVQAKKQRAIQERIREKKRQQKLLEEQQKWDQQQAKAKAKNSEDKSEIDGPKSPMILEKKRKFVKFDIQGELFKKDSLAFQFDTKNLLLKAIDKTTGELKRYISIPKKVTTNLLKVKKNFNKLRHSLKKFEIKSLNNIFKKFMLRNYVSGYRKVKAKEISTDKQDMLNNYNSKVKKAELHEQEKQKQLEQQKEQERIKQKAKLLREAAAQRKIAEDKEKKRQEQERKLQEKVQREKRLEEEQRYKSEMEREKKLFEEKKERERKLALIRQKEAEDLERKRKEEERLAEEKRIEEKRVAEEKRLKEEKIENEKQRRKNLYEMTFLKFVGDKLEDLGIGRQQALLTIKNKRDYWEKMFKVYLVDNPVNYEPRIPQEDKESETVDNGDKNQEPPKILIKKSSDEVAEDIEKNMEKIDDHREEMDDKLEDIDSMMDKLNDIDLEDDDEDDPQDSNNVNQIEHINQIAHKISKKKTGKQPVINLVLSNKTSSNAQVASKNFPNIKKITSNVINESFSTSQLAKVQSRRLTNEKLTYDKNVKQLATQITQMAVKNITNKNLNKNPVQSKKQKSTAKLFANNDTDQSDLTDGVIPFNKILSVLNSSEQNEIDKELDNIQEGKLSKEEYRTKRVDIDKWLAVKREQKYFNEQEFNGLNKWLERHDKDLDEHYNDGPISVLHQLFE